MSAVASSGPEEPAAIRVAPATSGGRFRTEKQIKVMKGYRVKYTPLVKRKPCSCYLETPAAAADAYQQITSCCQKSSKANNRLQQMCPPAPPRKESTSRCIIVACIQMRSGKFTTTAGNLPKYNYNRLPLVKCVILLELS
jgi:hypothetical protein